MARRRERRRSTPFRSWGIVLLVLLMLMLTQRNWGASTWIGAVLVFYLFAVKLTLCRVETLQHRPCRWKVRGYLRCCDYHLNLKQGPPSLVWISGWWTPQFMWRRHDLASGASRYEPQPRSSGAAAVAANAQARGTVDRIMMALAAASLIVAIMSFVRDVVAG